ncbi:hypothetical protein CIHG_01495 [Coccidioides immitis H538.4]|uniref:Uncharacterized protein n=3 Tax=Coccidioides immitis TaxID=5501 RepID=A0A0J8QTY1_COCIT|nr:hypothetical protein CIRG_01346 [Coccidioides immitis RMSCC 2394]KMU75515.1 hypothetical protein CISG_05148 [Coccidioides immitis RMSCC 3703]KMU83712.1 hypothetical protein CIHG_01495 [Coccidioides immitis H538.4]
MTVTPPLLKGLVVGASHTIVPYPYPDKRRFGNRLGRLRPINLSAVRSWEAEPKYHSTTFPPIPAVLMRRISIQPWVLDKRRDRSTMMKFFLGLGSVSVPRNLRSS